MSPRVYILALWLRLWHWTNAFLIIIQTITGLSLHFARPGAFLMDFSLARGLHYFCGACLCVTYGVYVVGNIVSGNWHQITPTLKGFLGRAAKQARYYAYGMFKGETDPFPPTPEQNLNPLEQITFWILMYLVVPVLLLTGLMFMFPQFTPDTLWGVDGLLPIAVAHYAMAFIIICFMALHVYFATTGDTLFSMVKMMLTGWHEPEEHP